FPYPTLFRSLPIPSAPAGRLLLAPRIYGSAHCQSVGRPSVSGEAGVSAAAKKRQRFCRRVARFVATAGPIGPGDENRPDPRGAGGRLGSVSPFGQPPSEREKGSRAEKTADCPC